MSGTKYLGDDTVQLKDESVERNLTGLAAVWLTAQCNSGAPSALDSLNVSSLTDTGTGQLTPNYTNSLSSVNYSRQLSAQVTSTAGTGSYYTTLVQSLQTASGGRSDHYQNAATADPVLLNDTVHGDLA